jgi:nucleotide-binding universal stress UspA family protein
VIAALERDSRGCYVPSRANSAAKYMSNQPSSHPVLIKNILVATDFSQVSETALMYSLRIAQRNGAKVWIVHVVPEGFFSTETQQRAIDDAWREGHRRMTEHFIAGHLDGIEYQLIVEQGGTWDVLSRMVEHRLIDLLVIGTRGRSRIGKLLLGSVAESVFRQAPCPVLSVGPKTSTEIAAGGPRKILYCTGFSRHSENAGKTAVLLAERQNAELLLLHVAAEETPNKEQYAEAAKRNLQEQVPQGANLVSAPKTLVEFGVTPERILAVATQEQVGLIVLGIRQPEGFARRLRWATAYEVVTNAPCPVLTVRMPEL